MAPLISYKVQGAVCIFDGGCVFVR